MYPQGGGRRRGGYQLKCCYFVFLEKDSGKQSADFVGIAFVGIYRGIESFQLLLGAGCRPSTVLCTNKKLREKSRSNPCGAPATGAIGASGRGSDAASSSGLGASVDGQPEPKELTLEAGGMGGGVWGFLFFFFFFGGGIFYSPRAMEQKNRPRSATSEFPNFMFKGVGGGRGGGRCRGCEKRQ